MSTFAENFWEPEFTSTNGFDVLQKRTKDGREMCKDYEEFLKQRSRAERSYGDNLLKLAKNAGGKEEIGGLKVSWDELVKQTENVGLKHIDLSIQLQDESKKIEEFREKQRDSRKKPIEGIKLAQSNKREWHSKVMQSKRTYESKCKEKDAAIDAHNKGRITAIQLKEVEKLQQKHDRAVQAFESAEAVYKSNVKTLEDFRCQWEEQMVSFCATIQRMEEERIKFLRGNMWTYTNIISLQCIYDDQVYDNVRDVLQSCDHHQDSLLFISQKGTSKKRPVAISFEDYYKSNANSSPHSTVNGAQARKLPPPPADTQPVTQRKFSDMDGTYAIVQGFEAANSCKQSLGSS